MGTGMAYDWDGTAVGVLDGAREDELLWQAARRLADESSIMNVARQLQMSGNGLRDAILRHDPTWCVSRNGSSKTALGIAWDAPVRETLTAVDERVPPHVTLVEWAAWHAVEGGAGWAAAAALCGCAMSSLLGVVKRRGGQEVLVKAARVKLDAADGGDLTPGPSRRPQGAAWSGEGRVSEKADGDGGETARMGAGETPAAPGEATADGTDGSGRDARGPSTAAGGETETADGGEEEGLIALLVEAEEGVGSVRVEVEITCPLDVDVAGAFITAMGLEREYALFTVGWAAAIAAQ